jgi:hypothetical protein
MAGSEYYNDAEESAWAEMIKKQAEQMMTTVNKEWEEWVDSQNHSEASEHCPKHYNNDIQPWDYMQATMSPEAFEGFLLGNVIKYVSRYKKKNGREDLRKAQHYLEKMLETV